MKDSPVYFDPAAGVPFEFDELPRGPGGVIQFANRHEAAGDDGHTWDRIYSGRRQGQQERLAREVSLPEVRWKDACIAGNYFRHLNEVAASYETGHALEIGCGTADTAFLLSTRFGWDVYGIDVSASAVGVARDRFSLGGLDPDRLSIADIEELPFDDATFDLVFGKTVFEHFEEPDVAAAEIARVTRDGGHVVLDVPNARNSYWTLASERAKGHTHLTNVYTAETCGSYFERHGFRIIECWGEGILYMTPYILLSEAKRALGWSSQIVATSEPTPHPEPAPSVPAHYLLEKIDRLFKASIRTVNRLADRTGIANPKTGVLVGIVAVRDVE